MIKDILLVQNYETYVLQNVLHVAFWQAVEKRVLDWVGDVNKISEKLPGKLLTQWGAFRSATGNEDHYYLLANNSEYTAKIDAADKLRDDIYRKIKKIVDAFAAVDFDKEKNEAALVMQPIMKRYAIDPSAAYEVETTKLDQWIQEQNRNYQAEKAAKALGIYEQIQQLKTANDEVRKLISWRMDEQGETPLAALKQARIAADEEWKYFVLALNSYAVADETDYRFEQLIKAINAEIAYSKEQYAALKKKNASPKPKKDSADTAPEPTAPTPVEPDTPADTEAPTTAEPPVS